MRITSRRLTVGQGPMPQITGKVQATKDDDCMSEDYLEWNHKALWTPRCRSCLRASSSQPSAKSSRHMSLRLQYQAITSTSLSICQRVQRPMQQSRRWMAKNRPGVESCGSIRPEEILDELRRTKRLNWRDLGGEFAR